VRASTCREEVAANRGRLAITRGPLVYCAESVYNSNHVYNYLVTANDAVRTAKERMLAVADHETVAVTIDAQQSEGEGPLKSAALTLVPYFAWNNRGTSAMEVWIPDNEQTLQENAILISDNAQRFKSTRASHTFDQDRADAIIDGRLPKNSFDTSIPRWTSWPERGKPQSVELELAEPTNIRTVEVYWYDDHGGVQVPERWSLEVQNNGEWEPFDLYNTDEYGVAADQYNVVHPAAPVTAERLRLQLWPKGDAAVGILEVVVEPEE